MNPAAGAFVKNHPNTGHGEPARNSDRLGAIAGQGRKGPGRYKDVNLTSVHSRQDGHRVAVALHDNRIGQSWDHIVRKDGSGRRPLRPAERRGHATDWDEAKVLRLRHGVHGGPRPLSYQKVLDIGAKYDMWIMWDIKPSPFRADRDMWHAIGDYAEQVGCAWGAMSEPYLGFLNGLRSAHAAGGKVAVIGGGSPRSHWKGLHPGFVLPSWVDEDWSPYNL